jgi:hypothetical protein
MTRRIGVLLAALVFLVAGHAQAQGSAYTPGTIEITVVPGGGTFFTSGDTGSSFGNYNVGGSVTFNVNRIVGFEGEVGGTLGMSQDLQFAGFNSNATTPNLLNYAGNVVVSAPTHVSVVPYVTGGVGGLTLFDKPSLGIQDTETFLTGNVGGGVKWFRGRWGLRGDYRFIAVKSKDDAPAFFGQETRYGHRVYGGVVINAGR